MTKKIRSVLDQRPPIATADEAIACRDYGAGDFIALGIHRSKYDRWIAEGILVPDRIEHGIKLFCFGALVLAMVVNDITERLPRLPLKIIKQSMEQIARCWPASLSAADLLNPGAGFRPVITLKSAVTEDSGGQRYGRHPGTKLHPASERLTGEMVEITLTIDLASAVLRVLEGLGVLDKLMDEVEARHAGQQGEANGQPARR